RRLPLTALPHSPDAQPTMSTRADARSVRMESPLSGSCVVLARHVPLRGLAPGRLLPLHLVPQRIELLERCRAKLDASLSCELLQRLEATRKLPVGPLQGLHGVHAREAGEVHDREQEVAQLLLQCRRRLRLECLPYLLQ